MQGLALTCYSLTGYEPKLSVWRLRDQEEKHHLQRLLIMSKAKEKRGYTIAKDLKAAEQLVPQLQESVLTN